MSKICISIILIFSIFVSGCSKGVEKQGKTVEEIQGVILQQGWKVEFSEEASESKISYLVITLNSIQSIKFMYDVNEKKVLLMNFLHDYINQQYHVNTETGKSEDFGLHYNGETNKITCSLFNISKMKEDMDEKNDNRECSKTSAEKLEDTMEERNATLKSVDLTMDDLFTWGEWYLTNKN